MNLKVKVNKMIAISLKDYINLHFNGSNAHFARHYGLCRQNIRSMILKGYVMINGEIYRPMAYRE